MSSAGTSPFFARVLTCWNWKCALISATARSAVYLAALAHPGSRGSLAIVVVEVAYVCLTAGLYAGLQQRALGLRSRSLGNAVIVVAVPLLSQFFDWIAHRAVGAPAPPRATVTVCIFAIVSALFHLHVMRHGALLTGQRGRSLADDLRRMPRLAAAFALAPITVISSLPARLARILDTEAAL